MLIIKKNYPISCTIDTPDAVKGGERDAARQFICLPLALPLLPRAPTIN